MPAVNHRLDLKLAKIVAESSGLVKQSSIPPLMVHFQNENLNRPQLRPALVTKADNDPTAIMDESIKMLNYQQSQSAMWLGPHFSMYVTK